MQCPIQSLNLLYPSSVILNIFSMNEHWMQYFNENPDYHNPKFNTKLGVYSEGCGLEKVLMSWGHDDYMYLVSARIIQAIEQFFEHPAPAAAVFLNVQIFVIHLRWPRRTRPPFLLLGCSSSDTTLSTVRS